MSSPRISVLVPTTGRSTLGRALRSTAGSFETLVDYNQDGDFGYAARNRLMARARGTHLAFIDDDDVFASGALIQMTMAACDRPVIFRMRYAKGDSILWKEPSLGYGNIGTPMFLIPNIPHKLGRWHGWEDASSGGDSTFIHETVALMGAPKWNPFVVAIIRPD